MVTREYVESLRLKPGQTIRVNVSGLVQEASYGGIEDGAVILSHKVAEHEYLFGVRFQGRPTGEVVKRVERRELRNIRSISPASVDEIPDVSGASKTTDRDERNIRLLYGLGLVD